MISLSLVPFAFLAGLLRSRVAGATAVSELVARLGDPDERRRGLRNALADASATRRSPSRTGCRSGASTSTERGRW